MAGTARAAGEPREREPPHAQGEREGRSASRASSPAAVRRRRRSRAGSRSTSRSPTPATPAASPSSRPATATTTSRRVAARDGARASRRTATRSCARAQACCGMPNLDGGDIDAARAKAQSNVAQLLPARRAGCPVVVPGPDVLVHDEEGVARAPRHARGEGGRRGDVRRRWSSSSGSAARRSS